VGGCGGIDVGAAPMTQCRRERKSITAANHIQLSIAGMLQASVEHLKITLLTCTFS
jgi:hypothetical protein